MKSMALKNVGEQKRGIIMSREIKFRAWLKEEKKMVNVETIDFSEKSIQYLEKNEIIAAYLLRTTFLEDVELMQYTGLKDSEDYEIYEKDIVWNEYDEEYQVIIFNEGEYKLKGETSVQNLWESLDYIYIRGNVYEDLEIIEAWYKEEL